MTSNIVIDFGNTMIKLALFNKREMEKVYSSKRVLDIIREIKKWILKVKTTNLILSGSAPTKLKQLLDKFDVNDFAKNNNVILNLYVLDKNFKSKLRIEKKWLNEIGMDLYAIGSLVAEKKQNTLVILMGTANVSLYVSKNQKLVDVAISSGIGISNIFFRKKAELISQEEGLMNITDKALHKGQQFLANGYLHSSVEYGKECFQNESFQVIISGGDSLSLMEARRGNNKYLFIDNLTLKSYNYLFAYTYQIDSLK